MQAISEKPTSKDFNKQAFITQLLEALENGHEEDVKSLLEESWTNTETAFRELAANPDKQIALLKRLLLPSSQKLSNETQGTIKNLFLNALDYVVRNSRIQRPYPGVLHDISLDLAVYQNLPESQRSNRVNQLICSSYMHCHDAMTSDAETPQPTLGGSVRHAACVQVRDRLVQLGSYEHALFFGYLVYCYSRNTVNGIKDEILHLCELLKIIARVPNNNTFKEYRNFFISELRKKFALDPEQALKFFEANKETYQSEIAHFQLLTLTSVLSNEQKFHYLLRLLVLNYNMSYYEDLLQLSKEVKVINLQDLDLLTELIGHQEKIYFINFPLITIHDTLAERFKLPIICRKQTAFNSINEFSSRTSQLSSYEEVVEMIASDYEGLLLKLICACFSKNFKTIDLIVSFIMKQASIDPTAPNRCQSIILCLSVYDEVVSYLICQYGFDNLVITKMLQQPSIPVIRQMLVHDSKRFFDLEIFSGIFFTAIKEYKKFRPQLIDIIENLPNTYNSKRIALLNNELPDFLLDIVLSQQDDQSALRLYKLGACKFKQTQPQQSLFAKALSSGCIEFALYLLTNDKSLRTKDDSLKADVLDYIRMNAGLWLSKFPALDVKSAQSLLERMATELNDRTPMGNLLQSGMIVYISKTNLQAVANSFRAFSQNYLILKELAKNEYIADRALMDFLTGRLHLNPDCIMLLLRNCQLRKFLDSKSAVQADSKSPSNEATISGPKLKHGNFTVSYQILPPPITTNSFATAIKTRLLATYPYTATLLISLLSERILLTEKEPAVLVNDLYLLFEDYIFQGKFDSPVLSFLFLKFPPFPLVTNHNQFSNEKFLAFFTLNLIKVSYREERKHLYETLQRISEPNSRFCGVVRELKLEIIFFEKLPQFLCRIRPNDREFITACFEAMRQKKPFNPRTIRNEPQATLQQVLDTDEIQTYRNLIKTESSHTRFDHVFRVCTNSESKILHFLFKQHELKHCQFTRDQIIAMLKFFIDKNLLATLKEAYKHGITDPNSTHTTNCLYLYALNQSKFEHADYLMPTLVTSGLLISTVQLGPSQLFRKALDANSRLAGKEEQSVSYEELERICINDREKLTIIALSRINTRNRWEQEFGTLNKRSHYKVKSKNPSGEELIAPFLHQLQILKTYGKAFAMNNRLTSEDLQACDLALKELLTEYQQRGSNFIKQFVKDEALIGQLSPLIQSLEHVVKHLSKDEQLSEANIQSHLAIINSLRSKLPKQELVTEEPQPNSTAKKKKKNKKLKKKPDLSPTTATPIIIAKDNGLYDYKQQQLASKLVENCEEPIITAKLENTLIAIHTDLLTTITAIQKHVAGVNNRDELEMFSDEDCNSFMAYFTKAQQLFWELDEELTEKSPYHLFKQQLDLLDCSQKDNEIKIQITLLAKSVLDINIKPEESTLSIAPIDKSSHLSFFQPAILLEDINQFCIKRTAELRLLLKGDVDDLHFCVFRTVNALSNIFRPARLIRHLLIHEFYNISPQDLQTFAQMLINIDLANKKSFIAIQQSALYKHSQGISITGKRVKPPLNQLLATKVDKLTEVGAEKSNYRLLLWNSVLVGELARHLDLTLELGISRETQAQYVWIRNKVAHEDYKQNLASDNELISQITLAKLEGLAAEIPTTSVLPTP